MSKAFTKESDGEIEDDLPDLVDSLPPGVKNYITPEGHARLDAELRHLTRSERPKVAEIVSGTTSPGDRSEIGDDIHSRKRLREIDRRIRYLVKHLEIAEVVDPRRQTNRDQVFFGATVTYADSHDRQRKVRIVGVDEARPECGEVSWISPLARALLKAGEGDLVKLRTPAGIEEIDVLKIVYREA